MDETVQRYLDAIPPEQKPLFERLQSLILQLYPDAEIVISYQIPTYKAKAGRVSLGRRNGRCRGARPVGPWNTRAIKARRAAGLSRAAATCASAHPSAPA
jgi:hypothetical protein